MEIQVEEAGNEAHCRVTGEADADNCHQLGETLLDTEIVRTDSIDQLKLDLGELQFIDSSAISELLGVRSELETRGTAMTISNASDAVRRVLEITGLLELFGVEE